LVLWLGLPAAANATVPPDELVRNTTDELLSKFTANREALKSDKERLFQMVDEIVVPHFDIDRMSRYVLGKHWRDASDAQKQKFIEEFKTQLVRTYGTALFEYTGEQEIIYKPFRHEEGDKQAVVKTEVPRADGPSIPVEYKMILNDDQWQVYDVVIENLSTVQNYRAQYGTVVNARGLDGLIASLTEKNQKLMSGASSE
jgi:phospholipid transport system substrate-binding protein